MLLKSFWVEHAKTGQELQEGRLSALGLEQSVK
jgi:hypothetical protein